MGVLVSLQKYDKVHVSIRLLYSNREASEVCVSQWPSV